jgi:DNA-binding response OmpR family regulator
MHTLLAISEPPLDAALRAALLAGGVEAREPAGGALEAIAEAPDALLVALSGGAEAALRRVRELREREVFVEVPAIVAIERREVAAFAAGRGADDFVLKPIDPPELLARVKLLLWRAKRGEEDGVVRAGADLAIDTARYEVTVAGRRADLTLKEYELLLFLARHPGRVFTREILLDRIWGQHYFGGTRTVDVHVRRLRMKIERGGRVFVDTVRGVGYRFVG